MAFASHHLKSSSIVKRRNVNGRSFFYGVFNVLIVGLPAFDYEPTTLSIVHFQNILWLRVLRNVLSLIIIILMINKDVYFPLISRPH